MEDAIDAAWQRVRNCGRCHQCGTPLEFNAMVEHGDEHCPKCDEYPRYRSHGWRVFADRSECRRA